MAEPLVQPLAPAAPAVESNTTTPAPAKSKGGLPDELLQIPAMQAVFAGQPAAFSAVLEEFKKRPEAKILLGNKSGLMKAGFGLYRSLDGAQGVIFNQLYTHGDEIKQADTEGRLLEVAPPFDVVNEAVSKSGADNPILSATGQTAFRSAPVPNPVAAPIGGTSTQPASVQKTTASARARNLSPGGPTSGAKPGAGRLLNSILRPVL